MVRRSWVLLAFALVAVGCGRVTAPILGVREISAKDLGAELASEDPPLVVDIRSAPIHFEGHIPGSVLVRPDGVPGLLVRTSVRRDRPVVIVAADDAESARAAAYALGSGYGDVRSLAGGMKSWQEAGGAMEEGLLNFATADEARPPPLPDDASVTLAATAATWMFRLAVVVLAFILLRASPSAFTAGLLLLVAGEASTALDVLFAGGGGKAWAVVRVVGVAGGLALLGRAGLPAPRRLVAIPLALVALLPLLFPLRPVLASISLPGEGDLVALWLETLLAALRAVPVAAAALLLLSVAGVRGAFGAGAGLAAYGLLRLVIAEALPGRPVFGSSVEETILLAGLVVALILVHRAGENAEPA